jgi:hypothetical protein
MQVEAAQAFVCSNTWAWQCKLEWIMTDRAAAASLIGAFVTAAGLIFAGSQIYFSRRQHEEERRWKRSEFVRTLLSEMVSNPNIALISRILDWREGPAPIPAPFQGIFDARRKRQPAPEWDTPRIAETYFEISWDRFIRSLKVLRDAEWREPDMYAYRTCFDSFCTFIQGVAEDVRTLGVVASEYADLSFYCHRIIFPLNAARERDFDADVKLQAYIEAYYNAKTYNVILRQAQVYALSHPGEDRPSDKFPDRITDYPTEESVRWRKRRSTRAALARAFRSRNATAAT